ncbi:MAG: glycosyltransferase family 9 protein [Burkholderiales bacterium]|nr:glycosyltransferase family 9 protein [Burkholderiales bacterium]
MKPVPRRILVVVTRRIGDVLLATALIRSLKQAWPDARIEALVFAGTEGVLAANPDLAAVHTVPERPGMAQHLTLLMRLFKRYDLALSLLPGDRPTLYAWLGGRRSIGLLIDQPGQGWKQRLLDQWVTLDAVNTHTVRAYLALAGALAIPAIAEVVVSWRAEDAAAVDALLGKSCGALAVLHPYPKFRYKMWHQQGWIDVARWLLDNDFRVALTGSPDADERAYVDAIAQQLPGSVINAAGKLSLGGTAALLTRAQFYVGPDTAVTHMAAATGVPMIALFGPTDPVKWGPWPRQHPAATNPWRRLGDQRNGKVQLLQGHAACVPCAHEGCERHVGSASDCLLAISAAAIINRFKTMAYEK